MVNQYVTRYRGTLAHPGHHFKCLPNPEVFIYVFVCIVFVDNEVVVYVAVVVVPAAAVFVVAAVSVVAV